MTSRLTLPFAVLAVLAVAALGIGGSDWLAADPGGSSPSAVRRTTDDLPTLTTESPIFVKDAAYSGCPSTDNCDTLEAGNFAVVSPTRSLVVTLSFTYRTHGRGPHRVSLRWSPKSAASVG